MVIDDSDPSSKLKAEVQRTFAAYQSANEGFKDVLDGIPYGLPHSDRVHRIKMAAVAQRDALDAYVRALRALQQYSATCD